MGVKNVKYCNPGGGNTGVGNCWNDIGIIRGFIKVPIGKIYSTATVQGLINTILADILADNPALRAYPVSGIEETTDNTKAPNTLVFSGTGREIVTGENDYSVMLRWYDGGFCLQNSMRKSKGQKGAYIFYDSLGQFVATDAGTTALPEQIKGIVCYNYTMPVTLAKTNSEVATYQTLFSFTPEQINENAAFVQLDSVGGLAYVETLNGLFNVGLVSLAARAVGVFKIGAIVVGCGNANLHDLYASELAVAGAWIAKNTATGAVTAITSVADNTVLGGWTLTLSTGDANYSATAGGITISLVGPTELAALTESVDGTGYESNSIAPL